MSSFLTEKEINELGFAGCGENVLISRNACIYGAKNIHIGSNVRIDDFCILSGNITLGNYIHISAGTMLFAGDAGIEMEDYTTVSSRCAIYAVSDDYSGYAMTNPMVPEKYRNVMEAKVILRKFAIVGTGCTILPGVCIGEGASVGCMSLVNSSLEEWSLCVGIPCKKIKERSRRLQELEKEFLSEREYFQANSNS